MAATFILSSLSSLLSLLLFLPVGLRAISVTRDSPACARNRSDHATRRRQKAARYHDPESRFPLATWPFRWSCVPWGFAGTVAAWRDRSAPPAGRHRRRWRRG